MQQSITTWHLHVTQLRYAHYIGRIRGQRSSRGSKALSSVGLLADHFDMAMAGQLLRIVVSLTGVDNEFRDSMCVKREHEDQKGGVTLGMGIKGEIVTKGVSGSWR